MTPPDRIWSVPVRVDDIPEGGRHFELHADPAMFAALARAAAVESVSRLDAVFDLTRYGSGGVAVVGTVSASVRQACVVTLDPVDNEVEEIVDLVFVPAREAAAAAGAATHEATDGPDLEALVDGIIDLGGVATEFLILGIDPYPRKPDAVFAAPSAGEGAAHPFAALADLAKGKGDGGS